MIRGEFNHDAPYFRVVINFDDSAKGPLELTASLLADTGADHCVLTPSVYQKMGISYDDFRKFDLAVDTGGFGGEFTARSVPGHINLRDEDGTYWRIAVNIDVAKPHPDTYWLPSVLGRDVLNHFRLSMELSTSELGLS